jgi:predicted transcriptional regulator
MGKVDSKKVPEIRERRARGETLSSIAEDHGVSKQTISQIVKGETYSDLGGPIDPKLDPRPPQGLTVDQVIEIRERRASGEFVVNFESEYDVNRSTLYSITRGERAPDIGGPIAYEDYDPDEFGHPNSKFNPDEVVEVRRRAKSGDTTKDIAEEKGVEPMTVSRVVNGKTYKKMGGPIKGEDYD